MFSGLSPMISSWPSAQVLAAGALGLEGKLKALPGVIGQVAGQPGSGPAFGQVTGMKFMAGEPMKPATKRLAGVGIDAVGGVELLDHAVFHDGDAIGQGHGLDLVVGHVDDRGPKPLVELFDLGAHLDPQFGIQVGQGFVKEEDARIAGDGPAHGHPLALPAGELGRFAVQ
jgi:hypothetical protein